MIKYINPYSLKQIISLQPQGRMSLITFNTYKLHHGGRQVSLLCGKPLTCRRAWQWWRTRRCSSSQHWAAGSANGSARNRHSCVAGSKARMSRRGGRGGLGPDIAMPPRPATKWTGERRDEGKTVSENSLHSVFLLNFALESFSTPVHHVWESSLSHGRGQIRKWVKYTGSKLADMSRNQIDRQTTWRMSQIQRFRSFLQLFQTRKQWLLNACVMDIMKNTFAHHQTHTPLWKWAEAVLLGSCVR